MSRSTTVGNLLLEKTLPEGYWSPGTPLDKKHVAKLLDRIAQEHPEKYEELSHKLMQIGQEVSYTTGGHSFGLKDMQRAVAQQEMQYKIREELHDIYQNPKLSDDQKREKIIALASKHQQKLVDAVLDESVAEDNPLARQLKGAGRGNKFNLNSLRGADLLYTDHKGDPVPIPVLHSYSQGLTPAEYFAASFGARRGIVDVKLGTADAGFLSKQLAQAAHRLVVEDIDDPNEPDPDQPRGLVADVNDQDNVGALLAAPIGGFSRNEEITPRMLKQLKSKGIKNILVRSPIAASAPMGGVYARDVGRRESGDLPNLGDFVGLAAAAAVGEPVSQGALSSKHTGGIAGAGDTLAGFPRINALIQVPKNFPTGAAHAQIDGTVTDVREAPQGGHIVKIGDNEHYIPIERAVSVKKGDKVEAGDVLSDGIPNPSQIVRYKGIGEGRRYFVQAVQDAIRGTGQNSNRRNVELVSRGLINHVRLTDEIGDFSVDDIMPYHMVERSWTPRNGHVVVRPKQAVGQYLEKPVLHYSVGTKIRPSMLKNFEEFGVSRVYAHKDPPPFEPEMVPGRTVLSKDPDWLTRMLGSYQQKSVLEAARRGATSDELGTSYVPALVRGENFGRKGVTAGAPPTR